MSSLGKRERVLRALSGEEVDKRPFTFWHPFGLSHMKAESLSTVAISFAAAYGVDLLRLPTVRDIPVAPQTSLDRPHDLTTLEPITGHSGFWAERVEALKTTVRLAEGRIAIFEVVPDPMTALSWICPPELLVTAERSHRSFLDKALAVMTESLRSYVKILLTEARIDGIVLEIASASFELREPSDFNEIVKPHLSGVVEEAQGHAATPLWFQLVGRRTYAEPLLDLEPSLLSWSHLAHGPALDKLPRRNRVRLAGGIDEQAVARASYQEIRRQVEEARDLPVALLCPGDTLSADLAPSRLQALSNFLKKRDRLPETASASGRPERIIDEP